MKFNLISGIRFPMEWLPSNGINARIIGSGGIINRVLGAAVLMSSVVAVIYIVRGAYFYITSAGESGEAKKAKDGIKYAIMGMVVIILAQALKNAVDTILI